MRRVLRVWVTGGGTREPIDRVRYVGNRSTGRMALALIEEAVARGHEVRALLAASVPAPLPGASVERFETARELSDLLTRPGPGPDVLLHAAAVADYAPDAVPGKIPSGREDWRLRMRPLPKVAREFRARHPAALLVLFKLETGVAEDELVARARRAAERSGAQLCFANLLEETGSEHRGWLVAESGAPRRLAGRTRIAAALLDAVEERCAAGSGRADVPGGAP